jgi:predicted Zn-dependent protease
MTAGTANVQFEDLVANTKKGLAFINMGGTTDFQQRMVTGGTLNPWGHVREIVNGKLGAVIDGLGFLMNAAELWKNLTAIGGPGTEATMWASQLKGEPQHQTLYSIQAVPGNFKDVTIVDPTRMV